MALGSTFPSGGFSDGEPMIGLAGFTTEFISADAHSSIYAALFQIQGSGGVTLVPAEANGVVQLAVDAGGTLQMRTVNFPFRLTRGKRLEFGVRLNLQDFDATSFFVGLAITDNEIVNSLPTDLIGFINTDEDGTIDAISRDGGTSSRDEVVSKAFSADNQWRDMKVQWDGSSRLNYYVDGKHFQLYTANIPTDTPMRFVIEAQSATAENLWVDYAYCYQER